MRRAFAAVWTARLRITLWVVAPLLLLLSSPVRAQELEGCDNSGRLFLLNLTTGTGTLICNLPTYPDPGATEIEYDQATAKAFLEARDGVFGGQMFNIFTCAGIGALLPTNDITFNGLEFVDGVLYGTAIPGQCQPSQLAILDPATGASTAIGPTGQGPIAGLAWDEETQTMYGITGCAQQLGPSKLVRVDLATVAAAVVGSTDRSLGSLEFGQNGLLYAGGDSRDGGNLYVIDPTSGASALVGPTGFGSVTGLTLVVRPLPVLISGFDATPFAGGVKLAWEIISDEEVVGFKIYRGVDGAGVTEITAGGLIPPGDRAYRDGSVTGGTTYDYTLAVVLGDRSELMSPVVTVATKSYALVLDQNAPNPFNPSTTISFTLAQRSRVTLSIYDVNGKMVDTLVDGTVGEGYNEYRWDGKDASGGTVSSGVYFYRLTSGKQTLTKKMVLLK